MRGAYKDSSVWQLIILNCKFQLSKVLKSLNNNNNFMCGHFIMKLFN